MRGCKAPRKRKRASGERRGREKGVGREGEAGEREETERRGKERGGRETDRQRQTHRETEAERETEKTHRRKSLLDWPVACSKVKLVISNRTLAKCSEEREREREREDAKVYLIGL